MTVEPMHGFPYQNDKHIKYLVKNKKMTVTNHPVTVYSEILHNRNELKVLWSCDMQYTVAKVTEILCIKTNLYIFM